MTPKNIGRADYGLSWAEDLSRLRGNVVVVICQKSGPLQGGHHIYRSHSWVDCS
jgi:hypothetical protein